MEEIGIISSKDGETFNEQLLNYSEKYQIKKEKNREKVAEWRDKQKDTKNVTSTKPVRNPRKVKETKVKETKVSKNKYGEFVLLSDIEYSTLKIRHGEFWTKKIIEKLDNHKGASGKTYKSDYRAILSWVIDSIKSSPDYSRYMTKRRKEESQAKQNRTDSLNIPGSEQINKLVEDEDR